MDMRISIETWVSDYMVRKQREEREKEGKASPNPKKRGLPDKGDQPSKRRKDMGPGPGPGGPPFDPMMEGYYGPPRPGFDPGFRPWGPPPPHPGMMGPPPMGPPPPFYGYQEPYNPYGRPPRPPMGMGMR